ncbi:GtrA family protein [Agrobacterium sp. ES01]|uniref:GtrA family protein n=1 Tax=Agrobacterium sp. ES01 TaxID=3420714 RepID=UPI003D112E90
MMRLLRFAVVGGAGFLVDASMLALLLTFTPISAIPARALAILTALAATWYLNRRFTFGASRYSVIREGFRYGSVGLTSALVNYLIFTGLLLTIPTLSPFAALIFSSIAAMGFSFFGYSRFVFRR